MFLLKQAFQPFASSGNFIKRALLFVAFLYSQTGYTQNQYWSLQYGGEASLMGGTAVVGVNDNSCIFYNPAAAHILDSFNVTASALAAGFEYRRLKNGAGNGLDMQSLGLDLLPQVLAISIPVPKVPKLKLIVGTLLRYATGESFSQQNQSNANVITGSPGPQYYYAHVQFSNNSVEQWAGLCASYKVTEILSLGVTAFTTYTHMSVGASEGLTADAFSNGLQYAAAVNVNNSMSLDQFNEVFKLGATARFNNVHLGAALSMPGIKLYGIGSLNKSFEVYNLNLNAVDTAILAQKHSSYNVYQAQSGLYSHYSQPFSASFGVELVYPKFKISGSLEFFAGHKAQTILQGAYLTYIRPSSFYTNDTVKGFMNLQTSVVPVLNAGLGAEVKLKPKLNLLLGIRTDFNNRADYLPNDASLNVAAIESPQWSYLYFSGGVSYGLAAHIVSFGFDYGVGIPVYHQQIFNITEPTQDLFLNGNLDQSMKTHVDKLNLILAWTYFFKHSPKNLDKMPFSDLFPPPKPKKNKKSSHSKINLPNQQVKTKTDNS